MKTAFKLFIAYQLLIIGFRSLGVIHWPWEIVLFPSIVLSVVVFFCVIASLCAYAILLAHLLFRKRKNENKRF